MHAHRRYAWATIREMHGVHCDPKSCHGIELSKTRADIAESNFIDCEAVGRGEQMTLPKFFRGCVQGEAPNGRNA